MLYGVRRRELHRMLARIYGKVGTSVNIREEVVTFMFDTSTCMLWGNTPKDQAEGLKELVREIVDRVFEPNISDFFPLLAPLDLQGKQRKTRMISHRLDEFFDLLIEKVKQADDAKDFLGILLKLGEDGKQQTPLTMENIKGIITNMIVGGTDTEGQTQVRTRLSGRWRSCKIKKR